MATIYPTHLIIYYRIILNFEQLLLIMVFPYLFQLQGRTVQLIIADS